MKAVITGFTGQDGSYLAEFLLDRGYEVHGFKRRSSVFNTERIDHIKLVLHDGDITDTPSIMRVLSEVRPDEIYHMAAQSHVGLSFEQPEYTAQVDGVGTLRLLEAARILKLNARIYNAATSEMFGNARPMQSEGTPFRPVSPYGSAKLYAYWAAVNYRESYKMFISNGILFNHESPRRGATFVTRKITRGLARIKCGLQDDLHLGNLNARRDWGHAKDYVRAMWLMLRDKPCDYVIATGKSHSVREFLDEVGYYLDLDWEKYVVVDDDYKRPTDIDHLCGESFRARTYLGWEPTIGFDNLVREMVEHDLRDARLSQGHTGNPAVPQKELRRA